MQSFAQPPIGSLVYSSDGYELGRVGALSSGCFSLDIQFAPDWWLAYDTIEHEEHGTFIVRLTREEIQQLSIHQANYDHVGFHLHP